MGESSESESAEGGLEIPEAILQQQLNRNHEENIQILVAVGILGAYFTMITSESFTLPGNLRLPVDVIFMFTLAFLTFKLAVNSTTPVTDWEWLDTVDRYFPLVYLVSVLGTSVTIVILFLSSRFGDAIDGYTHLMPALIFIVPFLLIAVASRLGARKQYQRAKARREKLREELPAVLSALSSQGLIEPKERASLLERYEDALHHDDHQSYRAYFSDGGLIGAVVQSNVAFRNAELDYLLTVSRRIRTNQKHGVIDERDGEAIREILRGQRTGSHPPDCYYRAIQVTTSQLSYRWGA